MRHMEAMICGMTPQERRRPEIIDGRRRARISRGSGTTVQQVNQVLEMRKQMERMLKQMNAGGKMRLPGQGGPAGPTRKATKARKKRRRR